MQLLERTQTHNHATKAWLEITTRRFEMIGRDRPQPNTDLITDLIATGGDLRIFTLHDPVDYKLRDIGN